MVHLYIMPDWFFELNLVFEILFALFTAAIAYYSIKIYKLSSQEESRNFGWSFGFLSLSYVILIFMNTAFLSFMTTSLRAIEIDDMMGFRNFIIVSYLFFMIIGLITLFYTTLKTKSPRIYALLLALSLAAIYFSCNRSVIVYLVSSILLFFVSYNYLAEYKKNKNKNTLYVGLGMAFLFASNILMGFVGNSVLYNFYVFSRVFEIAAYSIIMFSLIRILKYGKKKK